MKNDYLTDLLARLFDRFKIANPKGAAAVLVLLGTVLYVSEQGSLFGLFSIPDWLGSILTWVAFIFAAVTGSRTTRYLSAGKVNLNARNNRAA